MLCWVTISSRTLYPLPIHRSSWESHRHLQFIRTKTRDTHSASLPLVSSPIFPHLPIILLSWLKEETSQSTCLPLAHPKWYPKLSFANFANFAFEIYSNLFLYSTSTALNLIQALLACFLESYNSLPHQPQALESRGLAELQFHICGMRIWVLWGE